jgi:transposase
MSSKERLRMAAFARVKQKEWSIAEAARRLRISPRQAWRLYGRYQEKGDAGLVHKLRGRASNRRLDTAVREAVLKRYREKYAGFGPTLACEHLLRDGHELSHDTLGRWLREEGLFEERRSRGKHRLRRARRSAFGELLQMDGSFHDWFEGRRGKCCLMVIVDDATSKTSARFCEQETTESAFDKFGRHVKKHGLPLALYVDRDAIYRPGREATPEEELLGKGPPLTQFGRAMAELGVELILARSPEAKGRVERENRTLQDRLVKEMGLLKISTIEAGNAFLENGFLDDLNGKFAVEPASEVDAHRPMPKGLKLEEVLCVIKERVVGRDWCVQWRGRLLQIDKVHEKLALPGRRVLVRDKADGQVQLVWDGQELRYAPVKERAARKKEKPKVVNNKRYVPAASHPWNASRSAARAAPAAPARPLRRKRKP